MAGYYIRSLDADEFRRFVDSPSNQQCLSLAQEVLRHWNAPISDKPGKIWPLDEIELSQVIQKRILMNDWHRDLSIEDAYTWTDVVHAMLSINEALGIEIEFYEDAGIYWDCANRAEALGASMLAEDTFGAKAFRYNGLPKGFDPQYSIFSVQETIQLKEQVDSLKPVFESYQSIEKRPGLIGKILDQFMPLPDNRGLAEQFFEGLVPSVEHAAIEGRLLYVVADT